VRDLKLMAVTVREMGTNLAKATEYEAASLEGVHQLVYAKGINSGTPNLMDFVPKKDGGEGILESWMYYSFSGSGRGYFLGNNGGEPAKNCGYHKRNLSLLYSILTEQGAKVDRAGFQLARKNFKINGQGSGILDFMVKTYELKRDVYGLDTDTSTHQNGFYGSCDDDSGNEIGVGLSTTQLTYLKNY
jgi:hypothetical protein